MTVSDSLVITGFETPDLRDDNLPPQQHISSVADTQPYVYAPRYSTELTASEFSTILKFYNHPNAPKSQRRPQPSQPYVYVPGFSKELSAPELSLLLTFYTHPNAPKRRASLQPCQPHIYIPGYSTEYTASEQSALQAFSSRPNAWISRYSPSEQSALDAFFCHPYAWINRSFTSEKSALDFAAYRFSAARAGSLQEPQLQPSEPTIIPGQTQPAITLPMEVMNPEVAPPHPGRLSGTTQELITPAAVTVASAESTQSAGPSHFVLPNANPEPFQQQPAELIAVNVPQENASLPSTHDGVAHVAPNSAISAPPSVPVPTLAPPPVDDNDEDDDNNLLKAHRRVRAKRNILVGGPMKWMPEEVVYGLKEALKDLREANRKAKKRLLSRKTPISTTAFVDFTKDFEGFMPGDWTTRPKAKRAWINAYMQRVLDKACGREPKITPAPKVPGDKKKSGPSERGGNDGAAETAKDGAEDVDDLLPPGWAMGEDEVDNGLPEDWVVSAQDLPSSWQDTENSQISEPEEDLQATSLPANIQSTADAPASGLDSMMSKMRIGKSVSQSTSSIPVP